MSERAPERPRANFVAALDVRTNAVRGFAFGFLFALVVLLVFVVFPGASRPTVYYVGLGFVLATALGALATTVLTLVSAYRLAQELELD